MSQEGHSAREAEHSQDYWCLFKETFLKVARDYTRERLGDRGIEANFMIIDDG